MNKHIKHQGSVTVSKCKDNRFGLISKSPVFGAETKTVPQHKYQDLIQLFSDCFESRYKTKLISGEDEPIYLPADIDTPYHSIVFAHGFFSSALHECAHWFIAGEDRRQQTDYGYWYLPDGRSASEQVLFQQVEIKPQAIEWLLSLAARHPFRFSIDNLSGQTIDAEPFKQAVFHQAVWYCDNGLPERAQIFHHTLCQFYNTSSMSRPILDF